MMRVLVQILVSILTCTTGKSYEFVDDLYADYYNEVSVDASQYYYVETPSFTSSSIDQTVNEGETVRLPCKVDKLQGFVLIWKKDGKIIALGDDIIHNERGQYYLENDNHGSSLVIRLVRPANTGKYVCQVSALKASNLTHQLRVRVKPVLQIEEGATVMVEEGNGLNLSCAVLSGWPEPSLSWQHTGLDETDSEAKIVGTGRYLRIPEVSKHHAGKYTCLADNGFSSQPTQESVNVVVQYVPEIRFTKSHVDVDEGERKVIEFTCSADAIPKPSIAMLKGPHAILSNTSSLDGNTVTITSRLINTEKPEGEYICIATNNIGASEERIIVEESESFTLNKEEELEFTGATFNSDSQKSSLTVTASSSNSFKSLNFIHLSILCAALIRHL